MPTSNYYHGQYPLSSNCLISTLRLPTQDRLKRRSISLPRIFNGHISYFVYVLGHIFDIGSRRATIWDSWSDCYDRSGTEHFFKSSTLNISFDYISRRRIESHGTWLWHNVYHAPFLFPFISHMLYQMIITMYYTKQKLSSHTANNILIFPRCIKCSPLANRQEFIQSLGNLPIFLPILFVPLTVTHLIYVSIKRA